jgi:DNA-binding NarL/FixJ family response regulator
MADDPKAPIRVLIADDHPIVREGVVGLLARHPDIEVVGEAADGLEAVELFARLSPDITLLDMQMPALDGLGAIGRIRALAPRAAIIVLTTYPGDTLAVKALRAGASGYLLKNCIRRDLLDTVRAVHAGKKVIAPEVAQQIALHAIEDPLSEREVNILRHVAEGRSNKEIARRLSVSPDTIKADLKSAFAKLDVADRTAAVVIAARRGYIGLEAWGG